MAGVEQNPGPMGALTMNDPLFKNWLKSAYAFKYLKSGLEKFVSTQVGQRYNMLKQKVFHQCQQVQECSVCTHNNLLPDHGANGCRRRNCFCTHRHRNRRRCPNNFCSVFYDLIVKDHVENTPRWSSTDISVWYHDFFQYAKCFLGSHSPASSINELDCSGILSIVVHNRYIHHSINDVNLFKKCQLDRNKIFHTGNFEVTDQEFGDYIDDMIHALEDGQSLINDQTANTCVTNLKKLRNGQIIITDVDIVELVQDSLVAINELSDEVKQCIEKQRKQVLKDFNQLYAGAIYDIKKQKEDAVGKIHEHKADAVRQLSDQRDKCIGKIDERKGDVVRQLSEQKDEDIGKIDKHTDDAVRRLSEQRDKDISKIDEHKDDVVRLISQKSEEVICNVQQASINVGISSEGIRNCLMKIYKEDCCTLSVSPLCEEDGDEMELLSIYKTPSLYHVPYHRTHENDGKYPISSYKDIFCKAERCFNKIYITGDAGVGKTSFCKRMSLLWCKSQFGECVSDKSVQADIDFMSTFDFVFHVSLGQTHCKDVVAMIVEQLFCCENDLKKVAIYESVENILATNKCIIIMDAYDEWTPRESGKINTNRLFSDKCTFITTCRPYKLENERLAVKDIDRHVQMTGIDEMSAKHYVREIVTCINKVNVVNKDPGEFMRDVKNCGLNTQIRIPIMASHLIALWFDHKLTGMSSALIYSNIVDMFLKRAEKTKHIKLPFSEEKKVHFPDSLSELFYLRKHIALIEKICFLSFNILFKRDKCLSDLVFTSEQLESKPYCISISEIEFLCKFGILSKHKVIGRFGKREHKLSYPHKTYLEFFAAMFVSLFDTSNGFENVVQTWKYVDDVVQFRTFFRFLIGFSCERKKYVFENIYHAISYDLSLCRRNAIFHIDCGETYSRKIRSLQTMVINCLKEVSQSNTCTSNPNMSFKIEDFIFDFENYYESDSDDSCSVSDDVSIHNDSVYVKLQKQLVVLNTTCVKSICSVNGTYVDEFDRVRGLQYLLVNEVLSGDYAKFIKCMLLNKSTLYTICIKGGAFDKPLIPELPVRCFQHLTSLSLINVTLQHDRLHDKVNFLSYNVLIENIKLVSVSCDNHDDDDSVCTMTIDLP